MPLLRACAIAFAIVTITIFLLPFQAASVALNLPSQRWIPLIYHRVLCVLLGVRIFTSGTPAEQTGMVVANHASWLDIAVISAVMPVTFVAKSEVAGWPVFGQLAKLQRSIFVDRARRTKTKQVNSDIAQRLSAGDAIVIFAEGTSSDGNRVLPFRSALIGAAGQMLIENTERKCVSIQPLSVAYVGFMGLPMGRRHRERAAWYGSIDLLPHLSRVLREGRIDVVLTWGEPVSFVSSSDRKIVADHLETTVRNLTAGALRYRGDARRVAMFPTFSMPSNVFSKPALQNFGESSII